MGALAEGYATARHRRDDEIAEGRRKEGLVDHELHELVELLNQDATLLKDNEVTFDTTHRVMRVAHRRSPMATIHYSPEEQEYVVTIMRDASKLKPKTAEDCAKAIGELMFAVTTTR